MRTWIEDKTGVRWGTYRWLDGITGPAPTFMVCLRPKGSGWVRFEADVCGRSFYVSLKSDDR